MVRPYLETQRNILRTLTGSASTVSGSTGSKWKNRRRKNSDPTARSFFPEKFDIFEWMKLNKRSLLSFNDSFFLETIWNKLNRETYFTWMQIVLINICLKLIEMKWNFVFIKRYCFDTHFMKANKDIGKYFDWIKLFLIILPGRFDAHESQAFFVGQCCKRRKN